MSWADILGTPAGNWTVAFFCLGLALSAASAWKDWLRWAGAAVSLLAWGGLGFLWLQGFKGFPAWMELAEVLVFFSWMVLGAFVLAQFRGTRPELGSFWIAGVSGIPLVIARLLPAPALYFPLASSRSFWLYFHAPLGIISYAFFALAAIMSLLFLVKDRVRIDSFVAVASGLGVVFVAFAGGAPMFRDAGLEFYRVIRSANARLMVVDYSLPSGHLIREYTSVPGGGFFLWLSLLGFVAALVFSGVALFREAGKNEERVSPGLLGYPGEELHRFAWFARISFVAACGCVLGALIAILVSNSYLPGFKVFANPFRFSALLISLTASLPLLFLFRWRKMIEQSLPKAERIDQWALRAGSIGFFFFSLTLLSGSIWAASAWGRFWGWDPKESFALVTWLFYAIGLLLWNHRVQKAALGRWTLLFPLLGFVLAVFLALGVDSVFSGIHDFLRIRM